MTTKLHDAMQVTPTAVHYFYQSPQITITAGMVLPQAHGLSALPTQVRASLVCITAELNYSVGDEVQLGCGTASGQGIVEADATNVTILLQGTPSVPDKTAGTPSSITLADWKLVLRAWL
jgi:hypothetical protein